MTSVVPVYANSNVNVCIQIKLCTGNTSSCVCCLLATHLPARPPNDDDAVRHTRHTMRLARTCGMPHTHTHNACRVYVEAGLRPRVRVENACVREGASVFCLADKAAGVATLGVGLRVCASPTSSAASRGRHPKGSGRPPGSALEAHSSASTGPSASSAASASASRSASRPASSSSGGFAALSEAFGVSSGTGEGLSRGIRLGFSKDGRILHGGTFRVNKQCPCSASLPEPTPLGGQREGGVLMIFDPDPPPPAHRPHLRPRPPPARCPHRRPRRRPHRRPRHPSELGIGRLERTSGRASKHATISGLWMVSCIKISAHV